MQHKLIQSIGIAWTILFATFIIWIYATEPRNIREITAGVQDATVGYNADEEIFNYALELFRHKQYRAARDEWGRADKGRRDQRTLFYIAYAFYREGWHPVNPNEDLYKQGLEVVTRAIELKPGTTLTVDDPDLQMHSAAELKAELEKGLEQKAGDSLFEKFRPLK